MSDGLYLTSREAAQELGIRVDSLYSYVSRKGIRSKEVPGKRSRLYWKEDIDRLNGKVAESPAHTDSALVSETKISLFCPQGVFYRGMSAVELSKSATLEEVASLLWEQEEAQVFTSSVCDAPASFDSVRKALSGLSPLDQAGSLFPLLEANNPRNFDRSDLGFARAGAEALRWFAALIAHADRPTGEPVHKLIARHLPQHEATEDLVRRMLILSADHELTAPTYAVRAAANTGCTAYQVILTGLIASQGRHVVLGRIQAIRRLIDEMLTASNPEALIVERFREDQVVPGFGDFMYTAEDPRASAILEAIFEAYGPEDAEVTNVRRAVQAAREGCGLQPDFAFAVKFIERKLGFKNQNGSLFIVGRIAGWIAHSLEQMEDGRMKRLRAAYVGNLPESMTRPA